MDGIERLGSYVGLKVLLRTGSRSNYNAARVKNSATMSRVLRKIQTRNEALGSKKVANRHLQSFLYTSSLKIYGLLAWKILSCSTQEIQA